MAQIKIKQIAQLEQTLNSLTGVTTVVESYTTSAVSGNTGINITLEARELSGVKVHVNGLEIQDFSWEINGVAITTDFVEAGSELIFDSIGAGFELQADDIIKISYEHLSNGSTSFSGSNTGSGATGPQGPQGPAGSGSGNISGVVDGHIIPDTNEVYDLGSADKKFRDIYMSGNTLYMGGQPLSIVNGALTLNGSAVSGSLDTDCATYIPANLWPITSAFIHEISNSNFTIPTGYWIHEDSYNSGYNNGHSIMRDGVTGFIALTDVDPTTTSSSTSIVALIAYRWNGTSFQTMGGLIPVPSGNIAHYTGSGNGERIIITDSSIGYVLEYNSTSNTWGQIGSTLSRTIAEISYDGNTILETNSGSVYIWNGTDWILENVTSSVWRHGFVVTMSHDGQVITYVQYGTAIHVARKNAGVWNIEVPFPQNTDSAEGLHISGDGNTIICDYCVLKYTNGTWNMYLIANWHWQNARSVLSYDGTRVLKFASSNSANVGLKLYNWNQTDQAWEEQIMVLDQIENTVNVRGASVSFQGTSSSSMIGIKKLRYGALEWPTVWTLPAINATLPDYHLTPFIQTATNYGSDVYPPSQFNGTSYKFYFTESLTYKPGQSCIIYNESVGIYMSCKVISNSNNVLEVVNTEYLSSNIYGSYGYSVMPL